MMTSDRSRTSKPWVEASMGGIGVIVSWVEESGARLASAGSDGTILVWDPTTGESAGDPLAGHTAVVSTMTHWTEADGTRLASGGEDGDVLVWNVDSGKLACPPFKGHDGWILALESWQEATGRRLIASAGTDRVVRVWDAVTGEMPYPPLRGHTASLWALTHWIGTDGGARIASAGDDGLVRIWDATSGTPAGDALDGRGTSFWSLTSWRNDSGRLRIAAGGGDGSIRVWDPESGELIDSVTQGHRGSVRNLTTVTMDGSPRLVSAGTDGTVRLWQVEPLSEAAAPVQCRSGQMPALTAWEIDGETRIAMISPDDAIRVWNPHSATAVGNPIAGHVAGMWALTVSVSDADGPRVISAGDKGVISVWNPATGAKDGDDLIGHTAGIWALTAWSTASGRLLASAGDDCTIRIWDLDRRLPIGSPITGHSGWIPALTTWRAPDGRLLLASGSGDGTIRLWDPHTQEPLRAPLRGHSDWVVALTSWVTGEGRPRIASGSFDGTVRIWDPTTGEEVCPPLQGHAGWVRSLTTWASNDGRRMLASVGFDQILNIWDVDRPSNPQMSRRRHSDVIGVVTSWVGDNGGATLVTGSDDLTIVAWNGETGDVTAELTGHSGGIWALAGWRDYRGTAMLASSGYDGAIRLWDMDRGVAVRTIEVGPATLRGLSDNPADRDVLDRHALAGAIAEELDPEAESTGMGPAVIGIEGPWGCGKSTLMKMVQQSLPKPSPASRAKQRRLTARAAARLLNNGPTSSDERPRPIPSAKTRIVTAWFNPWAHQSGEQVWAGLVQEILNVTGDVLHPDTRDREWYWFRKNLSRIDTFAVRFALYRRLISPILGVGLVAVAAPLAISLAQLNKPLEILGQQITAAVLALAIACGVLLVGAVHTGIRYFFGRATRYLPSELFFRPVTDGVATGDGSQGTLSTGDPLQRAKAGSLYLHQHDIGEVLEDLDEAGCQLIVFIDDIDRCRPRVSAEVFEAVNLFLHGLISTGHRGVKFVIGLDPEVVAAHLDDYLQLSSEKTTDGRRSDVTPGWAFLRKMIQLSVPVPTIPPAGIARFVDTVVGAYPSPHGQPVNPIESTVQVEVGMADQLGPDGDLAPQPVTPPASTTRPLTPVETIGFAPLEQHSDIRKLIIHRISASQEPSLREAKRLLNIWQLYLRVVGRRFPTDDPGELLARSKGLLVLAETVARWPHLHRHLQRHQQGRRGLAVLAVNAEALDQQWDAAVDMVFADIRLSMETKSQLRELLCGPDGAKAAEMADHLL